MPLLAIERTIYDSNPTSDTQLNLTVSFSVSKVYWLAMRPPTRTTSLPRYHSNNAFETKSHSAKRPTFSENLDNFKY